MTDSGTNQLSIVYNSSTGVFTAYDGSTVIGSWSESGSGATGPQGPQGIQGETGPAGAQGLEGLSAYEVWLNAGNSGTEQDFLDSLVGPEGPTAVSADAENAATLGSDGLIFVQDIALAMRPFRIEGTASQIGGASAQPNSADDVPVTSDIQHIGRVLLGGAIGDTSIEQLHIKGNALAENPEETFYYYWVYDFQTGVTEYWATSVSHPDTYDNAVWRVAVLDVAGSAIQYPLQADSKGNYLNGMVMGLPLNDAAHVEFQADHPIDETSAPTMPISPYHTAEYTLYIEV